MDKELIYRVQSLLRDIEVVSYYNDSGYSWTCPFCGEELTNLDKLNSLKHADDCELMLVLKKLEEILDDQNE